ncbi:MAG: hypothetical protein JO047_15075 [Alphaproteobacteria bacterium]|nr:hypothetical protein [Alphaproteobacteria bacterium]
MPPLPIASAPVRPSPARPASLTSKTFWALMDRWGVADGPALTLIDRPGGPGAAGRRPRFSLSAEQARRLEYLLDVDATLRESWGPAEPRQWLARANPDPVFAGRSPLEHMLRGGLPAIAEVLRFLHHWGLKQSLKLRPTGP